MRREKSCIRRVLVVFFVSLLVCFVSASQATVDQNAAKVEIYKLASSPDVVEGGFGVKITDLAGKVYEGGHFWVVPQAIFDWAVIKVKLANDPWEKYLWLSDIRLIQRKVDSPDYEFALRSGQTISGTWLRGKPGVHPSDWQYKPKACWYSFVGNDYCEFRIKLVDILSIEFTNSDKALQGVAKQKEAISKNSPVTVVTAKGEVKADSCFLAMTGSMFASYSCYSQLVKDLKYFPEDYQLPGGIKDWQSVPIDDVSSVEFYEKENSRDFYGLKIQLKDGKVISGFLVSPGESHNGKWDFTAWFRSSDRLICCQKGEILAIPLTEVRRISWN